MNQLLRLTRSLIAGLPALFGVFAALACLAGPASAQSADRIEALMLVATPELTDPLYGATVLVARPISGGRHLGFILNKPSRLTVAQAFPKHEPSQKVKAPIYVGGPERPNTVFALVNTNTSPGKDSLQISPDLFIALNGSTIDDVIENDPEHARFLVGAVIWRPGELEQEIKRGAWYVKEPETELLMRKETGNLWEELVERFEGNRKAI